MNNAKEGLGDEIKTEKKKYVKTPWPVFIFQWFFLTLMCLLAVIQLPMGPFALPWNTFIVSWFSFLVLIVTAFGYIYYKNKKEEN